MQEWFPGLLEELGVECQVGDTKRPNPGSWGWSFSKALETGSPLAPAVPIAAEAAVVGAAGKCALGASGTLPSCGRAKAL
jgi:hypothetical protein